MPKTGFTNFGSVILYRLNYDPQKYLIKKWNTFLSDWPGGHWNPVKAGICKFPEEYYYSSARFYETGIDDFRILTYSNE